MIRWALPPHAAEHCCSAFRVHFMREPLTAWSECVRCGWPQDAHSRAETLDQGELDLGVRPQAKRHATDDQSGQGSFFDQAELENLHTHRRN